MSRKRSKEFLRMKVSIHSNRDTDKPLKCQMYESLITI